LSTVFLVDFCHSFFLGPVAVGLGVGAVLAAKGFILGAAIAGRRSRGHRRHTRSRQSYRYKPTTHYSKPNYHYSQPDSYYYSSSKNHGHGSHSYRGKRSVLTDMSAAELHRMRREVDSFSFDNWLEDMSTKDQDACGKKLVCELAVKYQNGKDSMTDNEITLAELFSKGFNVDLGQVEFDVAAEVGRKKGQKKCKQLYKRCETSLEELMEMINTEVKEMERVQREIDGLTEAEIQAEIEVEQEETEKLLKEAGLDNERVWD